MPKTCYPPFSRRAPAVTALALVALLAACAQTPRVGAVVEDRTVSRAGMKPMPPPAPVAQVPEVKPLPGAENAGKPGYYTVKPRDTLIQIALDNGQNWRDLAKWNSLGNVNLIEVGQVLSVGGVQRIMLDNYDTDTLRKAVTLIGGQFETEASGGITLETARSYADCGVDFISVGALTHSAVSLDLSLKAMG